MDRKKLGIRALIFAAAFAALILIEMAFVQFAIGSPQDFTGTWHQMDGDFEFSISNQIDRSFQFETQEFSGNAQITRKNTAQFQYSPNGFPNDIVTINFSINEDILTVTVQNEGVPEDQIPNMSGQYSRFSSSNSSP